MTRVPLRLCWKRVPSTEPADARPRSHSALGVMGATGHAFDLSAFEAAIQRDAEVLGVLYTGSLGGGTADHGEGEALVPADPEVELEVVTASD